VLDRSRTTPAGGWVAGVVGNGGLGVVGAVAVALWGATADGLAQRWGWTHPDPTLFDDGLAPWVLLAGLATAVDLALVVALHAVIRRVWRVQGDGGASSCTSPSRWPSRPCTSPGRGPGTTLGNLRPEGAFRAMPRKLVRSVQGS
jgi:hypothetical protein